MNRRFGFFWIWGLVTAAIATVVGLVAYHAGQTAQIVTTTGGDGRLVYPGYYGGGFGFFPFFGLFWILLIGFLFFRFFAWRSWGRGPGGWGGHYHDHTHGPAPTTPPANKPEDQTSVSV
jgi:hypothetical protein